MYILIIDKNSTIPIKEYGGTQRVIWDLGKELYKKGHKVYFLVSKNSTCDFATIIPYDKNRTLASHIPDCINVIHCNHLLESPLDKPYIITMHGNPLPTEKLDINMVFVSQNHAKRYGSKSFVYNGLNWNNYPKPDLKEKKTYMHFLGKANWKIKNVFGAAEIAKQTGNKLYVLGGDKWSFRNVKRGLKYLLNSNTKFNGMVNNELKIKLIQNSKALIFPVNWHEPFGLAIIESFYAGCAVFGTKNGSLNELIPSDLGYTGDSILDIVNAIKNFDFDPVKCHKYAVSKFNSQLMTNSYLKLYDKVISNESLNENVPKYIEEYNICPKI